MSELDEARAELARVRANHRRSEQARGECLIEYERQLARAERAERERDEARAEVERWKRLADCEFGDGCIHADDLFKIVELLKGKTITLPTTVPGAKAIRAVRAQAQELAAIRADVEGLELACVVEERDQARVQVRKLTEALTLCMALRGLRMRGAAR